MFSSKRNAFLGLIVPLLVVTVAFGTFAQSDNQLFSDVSQDHWAYEHVKYLAERGIITGLPGGQYEGEKAITRYQVAALVARAVQYSQQNPQTISEKDLSTLEDLVFKLSDRVESMSTENDTLQSQVSELQGRVKQLETSAGPTEEYQQLAQRNMTIAIVGVVAGLAAFLWHFI